MTTQEYYDTRMKMSKKELLEKLLENLYEASSISDQLKYRFESEFQDLIEYFEQEAAE